MRIKTPRLILRRILLSLTIVLLLLTAFFFATRTKPLLTFSLADGTQVAVTSLQNSNEFHLFNGTSLQHSFFKVLGDRAPIGLVGSESTVPVDHTDETVKGLGVILRRFASRAFLSSAFNRNQSLTLIDAHGNETTGHLVLVHADDPDTEMVTEKTKVTSEHILWKFPLSTEKQLHFRLYDMNEASQIISTNDFFLANPD